MYTAIVCVCRTFTLLKLEIHFIHFNGFSSSLKENIFFLHDKYQPGIYCKNAFSS